MFYFRTRNLDEGVAIRQFRYPRASPFENSVASWRCVFVNVRRVRALKNLKRTDEQNDVAADALAFFENKAKKTRVRTLGGPQRQ